MGNWYDKNNIFCAISECNPIKLEMYIILYGEHIITVEMMNFAILYSNSNILRVLHQYTNQVFDINVLKYNPISDDIAYFLLENYGGVKDILLT